MKVVLLQDVEKLGQAGDIVDVKMGYGRNYLLPGGLALEGTKENTANAEKAKEDIFFMDCEADPKERPNIKNDRKYQNIIDEMNSRIEEFIKNNKREC